MGQSPRLTGRTAHGWGLTAQGLAYAAVGGMLAMLPPAHATVEQRASPEIPVLQMEAVGTYLLRPRS